MRVVCDTNIFFSAIVMGGVIEEILTAAVLGRITIYISPQIILELARILKTKAKWTDQQISEAVITISRLCTLIKPTEKITKIKADDSDNRVLECAVTAKAEYLITGDKKHLLPLKVFRKTKIVSPGQFLIQVLYRGNGRPN